MRHKRRKADRDPVESKFCRHRMLSCRAGILKRLVPHPVYSSSRVGVVALGSVSQYRYACSVLIHSFVKCSPYVKSVGKEVILLHSTGIGGHIASCAEQAL
jgi:hypothetical protein